MSMEGLGSGVILPAGVPVELHEDEVPDLEPAPALAGGITSFSQRPGRVHAEVEVDLRAGSAGPGVSHGPEVLVLVEPVDLLSAAADLALPDLGGLVVLAEDG